MSQWSSPESRCTPLVGRDCTPAMDDPAMLFSTARIRIFGRRGCPKPFPGLQIEPFMESRLAAHEEVGSGLFRTWMRILSSPYLIAGVALLLRFGWILLGHTYRFKSTDANFGFGWEMGRIGASLASGHGFSNPFDTQTGPTAWEPPLYPYLTARVFGVFGIYSKTSAFVLLDFNSLCSALTCIPIFLIARRMFSIRVAVWSAWAWALHCITSFEKRKWNT